MQKTVTALLAMIFFTMTSAATIIHASQEEKFPAAWLSLVEAERAFARTSVQIGVRDSFIKFFADDGINFTPHPTKTKKDLSKRPATKSPIVLDWGPVFADISQAGDLGYTTGPYTQTDTRPQPQPTRHGFYFSIWKRQADGSWKVVLDCGITTPKPTEEYRLTAAHREKVEKAVVTPDLAPVREALRQRDGEFFAIARQAGVGKAFASLARKDVRVHRDGRLPMTGQTALQAFLIERPFEMTGSALFADVAQSADLGYTYGTYELKREGAAKPERGYYVRVWKRDGGGRWQVALDTTTTIPEN